MEPHDERAYLENALRIQFEGMTLEELQHLENERIRVERESRVLQQKMLLGIKKVHRITFDKLICDNINFRGPADSGG